MPWTLVFVFVVLPILTLVLWFANRAQKPPRSTGESEPDEDEEWLDLHDPRVPDVLHRHAASFRDPARYVVFCGPDILLLNEDGEVIDICALR